MDFLAVFYVPSFFRTTVPGDIPEGIAFFRTGLEGAEPSGEADPAVLALEEAFAARLPLSPGEARVTLAEMLALGRDRAGAGALLQQAAQERWNPSFRKEQDREELAALERFARTGASAPRVPDPGAALDMRSILVACHKILLLAQAQEKDRAEIADLAGRALRGERALRAVFGEEAEEESPPRPDVLASTGDAPPWRTILDASLPFMPEDALLFTADPRMALELQDAGMLRPFPGDLGTRCAGWPAETLAGLLLAEIPAWRLVGRRFLPPDLPWLARDLEVLVARPESGWPDAPRHGRER
jgi:hypothetical protein